MYAYCVYPARSNKDTKDDYTSFQQDADVEENTST